MCVARPAHDAEIDELGRDVRVDDANNQRRHNNEGEGSFSKFLGAEGPKCRSCGILAKIVESDCWWTDEEESGDNSQNGEGFREVLWFLHLGDEGWEEDLRDPEEGDVQDGVHAVDPGGAWEGERVGPDFAGGGVDAVVAVARVVLDAGEDEEEKDGDGHAECWVCQFCVEIRSSG